MADPFSNHFKTQATFNREANEIVLAALESRATPDPRAVAAFRHVLETELIWFRRLTGGDAGIAVFPAPAALDAELATCREWVNEASTGFERFIEALDPQRLTLDFTYFNLKGEPRSNVLSNVLQHVFLHSAQYRGEALGLLAATGPVPDIDFIFYAGGEARFGRTAG